MSVVDTNEHEEIITYVTQDYSSMPVQYGTSDPYFTTQDEQVTQLLPVVTPYMQHGYDMKLAAILAQMLGITPQTLIERTHDHQAHMIAFENAQDEMYQLQYGTQRMEQI